LYYRMNPVNVIIADNQPIFVEGLKSVLTGNGTGHQAIQVEACFYSGSEIVNYLKLKQTGLLILDISMPDLDGLKAISEVKQFSPNLHILILTGYDDPKLVKAAFKSGADGYLLKSSDTNEIFHAIGEIVEGNTYIGKGLALMESKPVRQEAFFEGKFAQKHGLTKREMEILRHIGLAMNNKNIANKLYISDQTVSVHRKNIMRKLGVNSTNTLIKIAYDNNLVG